MIDMTLLVCTSDEFLAATPAKRAVYVRDQLELTPELYDQSMWYVPTPCGTACCVAGWTCMLAGDRFVTTRTAIVESVYTGDAVKHIAHRAAELLDIAYENLMAEDSLFHPSASEDRVVEALNDLAAR